MQMHPSLQIQSMIKALTDVVLPAVDPANKLAQEQARLVIGTLNLMAQQLPLRFHFDCDQLSRLLQLAEALRPAAQGGAKTAACVDEMGRAAAAARRTLDRAHAGPEAIEQAVRELCAATSQVVRSACAECEGAALKQVEGAVLASSKEQLLRDRSWVLAQGWEPDPEAVPKIRNLLEARSG